jgi:protein SCO1/2
MRRRGTIVALAALAALALAPAASWGAAARASADPTPAVLRGVGLEQRLGREVPGDLVFRDESGGTVRLAELLGHRPVILTLNYYRCPMLCTMELNGLVASLRTLALEPGKDFRLVTVSIDPRETPDLAAAKKAIYVRSYGRPGAAEGWRFLTGEEPAIRRLSESVGYRYAYDETSGQFAHAAGILILTPAGRISRVFYGIDFPPRDLRLALVESSEGRIGRLSDRLLLFCYHYDPVTGRYGFAALAAMRVAGALTALGAGSVILLMLRRERRRRSPAAPESAPRAL